MNKKIIENEYLITNGIGGFSSSSVSGANTRKYHSILNASLNPPVDRHVLLSRIVSQVTIKQVSHTLESTLHENKILDHSQYLTAYDYYPLPTFTYQIGDVQVKKTLAMKYGENTSVVHFEIETSNDPIKFESQLHINCRDHHDLSKKGDFNYHIEQKGKHLSLSNKIVNFKITGYGDFHSINQWAEPEFYLIESRRGQDNIDINYIPGVFQIEIPSHTSIEFGIIASTGSIHESSDRIINDEIIRRSLLSNTDDIIEKKLQIACDNFIVDRHSTQSKTVIAGYPWFTDWGRDTMIALPGLTLATGRYKDAKDIIETFIKYEKDGLIPNMFPDNNIEPMYNTIDGTLWMFISVFHYYNATKDSTFIQEIFPTLEKIIQNHLDGTLYNIHVEEDGLLSGGDETTQLTWMDVKIDGHVVTPRHGKAVEINALWYNALNIMDYLEKRCALNSPIDFMYYASKCFESFNLKFWNQNKSCLYDVIQNQLPIDNIRPNQIFAVSLPFGLLEEEKEKDIVNIVEKELLTPNGLRSLSQDHKDYCPKYDGDVYSRDYAYHQGTVWGWLIGPFLEAHYNVYQDKDYVKGKLVTYLNHLDQIGLGGVSEVFHGNAPHNPRGCFSQAWSVSEAMRLYKLISE